MAALEAVFTEGVFNAEGGAWTMRRTVLDLGSISTIDPSAR